jgi:hypothetical protein
MLQPYHHNNHNSSPLKQYNMASNKRSLKAFVRYDGTGRLIAGSLILQAKKPKVGNWQEIDAYECCNPTTTTTTTAAPTTTTTTTTAPPIV